MSFVGWCRFRVPTVMFLALFALVPMKAQSSFTIITDCNFDTCTTTYMSTSPLTCFECAWDQSCFQSFFGSPGARYWCVDVVSTAPDGTGGNLYCQLLHQSCDPNDNSGPGPY